MPNKLTALCDAYHGSRDRFEAIFEADARGEGPGLKSYEAFVLNEMFDETAEEILAIPFSDDDEYVARTRVFVRHISFDIATPKSLTKIDPDEARFAAAIFNDAIRYTTPAEDETEESRPVHVLMD
jgi:hypothetical protein